MQCSSEASRRVPFAYIGTPGQGTASKVASTRHSRRRRALERPENDTLVPAASDAEQERQTLGQIAATGASGSGGSTGGAAFNMLAMLAAAAGGVAGGTSCSWAPHPLAHPPTHISQNRTSSRRMFNDGNRRRKTAAD